MVSVTVRLGYIAAVWSWTPMRSLSCAAWLATSRPRTRALPLSGTRRPSRISTVVVLPAPLGPSIPKTSPRVTSNETPSTAWTSS